FHVRIGRPDRQLVRLSKRSCEQRDGSWRNLTVIRRPKCRLTWGLFSQPFELPIPELLYRCKRYHVLNGRARYPLAPSARPRTASHQEAGRLLRSVASAGGL